MSEWSEHLVSNFAKAARNRREELGLKVQDVADRTAELGHPISRSAITDYELSRRKDRLMLGDALVLAEALQTTLHMLLYPNQPDGEVQQMPNTTMDAWTAKQILVGELFPQRGFTGSNPEAVMKPQRLSNAADSIASLRAEIDALTTDMETAIKRGNIDLATEYRKRIQSKTETLSVVSESTRDLGGVVNDG